MAIECVHVMRGNKVESIHRADIVIVDRNKEIIKQYGDPNKRTFWRSSAKPFQVLPFLRQNGFDAYSLDYKELALMTASHGGEPEHIEVLENLLSKMGLKIDDLDCGVSKPMYHPWYYEMLKKGLKPTQGNNPCSGKHTSMLGLCQLMSIDSTDYINKNHPVQQEMLSTISNITDLDKSQIDIAIDGCGVPVFGLPIYNMALAYSRLTEMGHPHYSLVVKAMTTEPFYVAGSKRLDTILMEETKGAVLAKLGAESVYCMSILEKGLGIAIKIEDGSYRGLNALVPDLLLKHNFIKKEIYDKIVKRLNLKIHNHRKEVVGEIISII